MPRSDLFPSVEPFESGMLRVDDIHTIYWEQSGNPDGTPVLFVHGGPGAGTSPAHRRYFDAKHYRIVLIDQRGAGRSTPAADLRNNTTQHLVADIETVREHLGIDAWLLFGGSWGSTLALAYGETYPEHCLGFILRGIFLCRDAELDWFLYGMRRIFPEAWRDFAGFLPEDERDDILAGYYRRLTDPDPDVHLPAARAWSAYEGACSTLMPSPETVAAFQQDRMALSLARIEAHYFVGKMFMGETQLLDEIGTINHLPCTIVQGRYDIVCPIVAADDLHGAWPGSDYVVVPDAGHSAMEPGVRKALVEATEKFKTLLEPANGRKLASG